MAKYGIYKVHQEDDAIKTVMALKSILGWDYANDNEYSKAAIIDLIKSGTNEVITIIKDSSGKWKDGAKVIIETIDNKKYIKTVANGIKKDNLDNLPQY